MKPQRYWLPVTTRTHIPMKCSSALWKFRGNMTKMLLVVYGKYPYWVPLTSKYLM